MPKVIWLASYPKSGNTWLRFLIAQLLGGPLASSAELQRRVPDAHRLRDWQSLGRGQVRLVKAHWCLEALPAGVESVGAIHMVRNPWDVIASNLRFVQLCASHEAPAGPEAEHRRARAAYIERFITHRGDPRWIEQGFGTWPGHAASWRAAATRMPVLCVRYEDLRAAPEPEVARIARFLGADCGPERRAAAIAAASFEAMRGIEEREIRACRAGLFWGDGRDPARRAGHRFVARGEASFGRDALTPAQWWRVRDALAEEVEQLGYVPAADARAPDRPLARSA